MKQELIYFKKILSQNVAVVFTCLLMSNSSYAEERHVPIDFPMPGSACQAYDEAALSSGELIRTTIGIKNSGKKDINIYCPVKTAGRVSNLLKRVSSNVLTNHFVMKLNGLREANCPSGQSFYMGSKVQILAFYSLGVIFAN